jgi:hypothetical protein
LTSVSPCLAEKKPRDGAVAVTKVSKSEEAIFTLKPGKAALVRLAACAQPFAPLVQFVSDGLQWKSTRKAGGYTRRSRLSST